MVATENKAWLREHDANHQTLLAMRRRQEWFAFCAELQKQMLLNYWRRLFPDYVIQNPVPPPEILTPADLNRMFREKEQARKALGLPELPEPLPSLDPDVQQIIARVQADGGLITDETFLNDFIVDLKAANVYSLLDVLYIPVVCKKDANNRVSKVYDLSPSKAGAIYYDANQSDPTKQQLWEANQIDGKPWIMFDGARGAYASDVIADIPFSYTLFVISASLVSSSPNWRGIFEVGNSATSARGALLYYPYDAAIALLVSAAAYLYTDILPLRQFTGTIQPPALSTIRCKGAEGNSAAITDVLISNGQYFLGQAEFGGTTQIGPIAFAGACRQTITDQQRDAIEGLLNTKYYPSTIG